MLITKSDAARAIGKSRQWIDQLFHDRPRPLFFVKDGKNKKGEWIWKVDTDHFMWKSFAEKYQAEAEEKEKRKAEKKNKIIIPEVQIDKNIKAMAKKKAKQRINKPLNDNEEEELEDLNAKSNRAKIEKEIYKNIITQEKSKQEEIRTLEMRKAIAPMKLLLHWYSFIENLIQRIYRRPHEISPELKALYMANEDKKAEQKIVRELEAIIKDVFQELKADIKSESFKMPEIEDGKEKII